MNLVLIPNHPGAGVAAFAGRCILLVALSILSVVTVYSDGAFASGASEPEPQKAQLEIRFNEHLLRDLGLDYSQYPVLKSFYFEGSGTLSINERAEQSAIISGSLNLSDKPDDLHRLETVRVREMELVPGGGKVQDFYLNSTNGLSLYHLDYGHIQYSDGRLESNLMDVKIAPEFAFALGRPELIGLVIGEANLSSQVEVTANPNGGDLACEAPNWPSADGAGADIAMTAMDDVVQTVRSNGRVAITPSAYFTNVGTTDVPWFAMFANPQSDPVHCIDDGNGQCDPYGTDQGGKLVWSLYRLHEGRLEQLGRSAVKHAFNSVNLNCPCSFGRIVWQGCEDLYGVNTNANRDFLGPRDELNANRVLWDHRGSIFDQDSNDQCDVLVNDNFYGGQQCETSPADILERRMHVAEADLGLEGARYFIETWYLVRDDINVLNSMGHREIKPTFSGIWFFPFESDFVQGPVLSETSDLLPPGQVHQEEIETPEGQLRLVSTVRRLPGDIYEYQLVLMNFDFDPAIAGLSLSLSETAEISDAEHLDGDSMPGNDWVHSQGESALNWQAPAGTEIRWGVLGSFTYRSPQSPHWSTVTLTPGEDSSVGLLQVRALGPGGDVFVDSFEP